jgi:hypothetical protein
MLNRKIIIGFIFLCSYVKQTWTQTAIKTNVLSLLITTPQLSVEQSIGNKSSVFAYGYSGKFTFISETKIRGVGIGIRRYFVDDDDPTFYGLYLESGYAMHGQFRFDKNKYDDRHGVRGLIGFQFGKKIIFDIGLGFLGLLYKYDNFDQDGNIIGRGTGLETPLRMNASVGYKF